GRPVFRIGHRGAEAAVEIYGDAVVAVAGQNVHALDDASVPAPWMGANDSHPIAYMRPHCGPSALITSSCMASSSGEVTENTSAASRAGGQWPSSCCSA